MSSQLQEPLWARLGVARLALLARQAGDGWVHEDDALDRLGRGVLSALVRMELVEMKHTRPARPGDQGFTVWYRPKVVSV